MAQMFICDYAKQDLHEAKWTVITQGIGASTSKHGCDTHMREAVQDWLAGKVYNKNGIAVSKLSVKEDWE